METCNGSGSPLPITRSDPNSPYPTTFVTADPSSFKQVVQMLTGSSLSAPATPTGHHSDHHHHHLPPAPPSKTLVIPPIKTKKQPQGFKLYERRSTTKNNNNNNMMISPLTGDLRHRLNASFKPPEILSPSLLDFPSLSLGSPVTPLADDPFDKSSTQSSEEEKAIAEKGFYLHPSPMSTARDAEPQLLPLFPVTSPRLSDPSS